jgi:serine/threonine protein kinase
VEGPSADPRDPVDRAIEHYVQQLRGKQASPGPSGQRSKQTDEEAALAAAEAAALNDLRGVLDALEEWKEDIEWTRLQQAAQTVQPGSIVGDYRIDGELGRGGVGAVYAAEHLGRRRPCAIKLLPWPAGSQRREWLSRWRQEARTIARLRHRNIVSVWAFGARSGWCYYVMELVTGGTLTERIRWLRDQHSRELAAGGSGVLTTKGPPAAPTMPAVIKPLQAWRWNDWWTFAAVALQLAWALDYAHECGVIHGDIKPGNVLLKPDGTPLLADFNPSVEPADTIQGASDSEHRVGTRRYLAPEAYRSPPTPASDVFALGTTIRELLTQSLPGQPATDDTPAALLAADAEAWRAVRPLLPAGLAECVETATAPYIGNRYPTARKFADDLQRMLTGRPVRGNRHPSWKWLWSQLKKRWRG